MFLMIFSSGFGNKKSEEATQHLIRELSRCLVCKSNMYDAFLSYQFSYFLERNYLLGEKIDEQDFGHICGG